MHKFLFRIKFIKYLYMFRALLCSSSGGQIVLYNIWYRHTAVGGRPVRSLPAHRTAKWNTNSYWICFLGGSEDDLI